jgi:polysaccharide export outer membrane protein
MIYPPRWQVVVALATLGTAMPLPSFAQPAASGSRGIITVSPPGAEADNGSSRRNVTPPAGSAFGADPIVVKGLPYLPPYRISAGDEIGIYVWGEERLQREIRVLPDGTFAFPLVGQVFAHGKLPREIEAIITERLKSQYRGQVPQVTVSVKVPSGLQFSVMGRVKSPGTFSPGRYVNVLDGLSMAGGATEFANLDNVLILRNQGDELKPIRVRVGRLFKPGADLRDLDRSNVAALETGDIIIVP